MGNSNGEKLVLEETERETVSSGLSQSALRQSEGVKPVQSLESMPPLYS